MRIILIILLGIWASSAGWGQNMDYPVLEEERYLQERVEPQNFERQGWGKLTDGLDYSMKKPKPKKEKKKKKTPDIKGPDLDWMGPIILAFFKIFAFVVVLVLLGMILRSYFLAPKNKALNAVDAEALTVEDIEENLEESEINPLLNRSLQANDYALAIRLYYLDALKQLSLRKLIFWRKNKTNRAYLNELFQQPQYEEFRDLTLIFERVRYGEQEIDVGEFSLIEARFKSFLHTLNAIPIPLNPAMA
jgi:hypothetical protein